MNIGAKIGITAGIPGLCTTVGGAGKWAHDSYYDDRYVTVASYEAAEIRKEIRLKQDQIDDVEFSEMTEERKQKKLKKLERQIEDRQRELDRLNK